MKKTKVLAATGAPSRIVAGRGGHSKQEEGPMVSKNSRIMLAPSGLAVLRKCIILRQRLMSQLKGKTKWRL
jgi:hypothetical protein